MVFAAPVLKMFSPSWRSLVRSTASNRTLSRICGSSVGTSTLSRFTTFPAVEAIVTARAELLRSLTVPRRKMLPSSSLTLRGCPGSSALSSRRSDSSRSLDTKLLARTETLKNLASAAGIPENQRGFPRGLTVYQHLVGLIACASAKSPSPTTIRVIGRRSRRTTDLPTETEDCLMNLGWKARQAA